LAGYIKASELIVDTVQIFVALLGDYDDVGALATGPFGGDTNKRCPTHFWFGASLLE
jgi:hypothetical protein